MVRFLLFILKSFLFVIAVGSLFAALLAGALQTQAGKAWLKGQVLSYAEQETGTSISIDSIDIAPPFHLRLKGLAVTKENQPLLFIDQVELSCLYPQLIDKRLVCSYAYIKGVHAYESLAQIQNDNNDTSSAEWEGTPLPFYVKFKQLVIDEITLDTALVNHLKVSNPSVDDILRNSSFKIEGIISNNPAKSYIAAHLLLTAKDTQERRPPLTVAIDAQNQQISASAHLYHFPFKALALPFTLLDSAYVNFAYYATAPLKTWQSLIDPKQNSKDPVKGQFHITIGSFNPSETVITSLIGPQAQLKGSYAYQSNGKLNITSYTLESALAFLKGHSLVDPTSDHQLIAFQGSIFDLEKISPLIGKNLKGEASVSGHLQGFLGDPLLELRLNSPSVTIEDLSLSALDILINGKWDSSVLKGNYAGSFDYKGHPFQMRAEFEREDRNPSWIHMPYFEWSGLQSFLSGHLAVQVDTLLAEGQLQGTLQQLELLNPFIPVNIKGKAKMDLTLMPQELGDANRKVQGLSGTVEGYDIAWEQIQAPYLLLAAQVRQTGNQAWTQLKVQADDIQLDGAWFEQLTLESTLDPQQNMWPFQLTGRTILKESLDFSSSGYWGWFSNQVLAFDVQECRSQWGGHSISSQGPFQLRYHEEEWDIASLNVLVDQQAQLLIESKLRKDRIACHCQGDRIPSNLLQALYPDILLTGDLSFFANIEGPLDKPEGQIQVFLQGVRVSEEVFANTPPIEGEVELLLNPSRVQFKGLLYGIGKNPITTEGQLPVTWSLIPFQFDIEKDQPLEIIAQAEGDLDPFLHLFYNDTSNLLGQAKIAFQVKGTWSKPLLGGQIDLFNGSFESLSTGAIYRNIEAHLEGDGSQLFLRHFSAVDNKQGSITAQGRMTLDASQSYPFEAAIHPRHISMIDSDFTSLSVSGQLWLRGNKLKSKLEGNLTLDQGAVHIGETKPKSIKNVDVIYVNLPSGYQPPQYTQTREGGWPVELNIKVDAPSNLSITGKNLTSDWKGEVIITGTPQNPLINGDLRVVQGDYSLNGKVFNFTQGNIHLAGPLAKKTTLYVVASREIDRITAEIIVKGPVDNPAFSFRSNPPLSEREVLSYILFNRGISDITTDQGNQLTQSFMTLSAETSNSSDFLSRIRNNMGIDRLDFSTGDNSEGTDFSLQVGKYISPGVMVSINKSLNDAANRVSIEAEIHKNWKAQADMGDDGEGKVSLKWKKNY